MWFSCTSQSDWATIADWEKFDDSDLPDQDDYPDAGAVILMDEGVVEIDDVGDLDFTYFERHRVIKVFNSSGYKYAYVSIGYTENSDVELIEARTISPDGKITVLDEENIFDITLYPNFVFFSDQRAKIFTFPAVDDGCILEYKYRIAMSGNTLMHSWYFQNYVPTELSRFRLKTPSLWTIDHKLYNIEIDSDLKESLTNNRITRTWEAHNVEELPSEIAMPASKDIGARIEISPMGFNSWNDVSGWYHSLSETQMIVDDEIRELAIKLTAGTNDEMEKVRRLFEWVRDRVRYVAVSIGIGGFKPHRSDEILLNRYGDCKDMTTLFCSLAKSLDISVHQALISTQPNGNVDTSLVSPFQFNHAIAYYPLSGDSGLWLDATKKGCPFGMVPWYNQNRLALIVDENGNGTFKRTPISPETENVIAVNWEADLDSNLNAIVTGKNTLSGAPAADLRQALMNLNYLESKQWIEGYLSSRCSGVDLISFSISNIDTVKDPLTILFKFETELFSSEIGDLAYIDLASILQMDLPDYFRSNKRKSPIEFRHGSISQLNLHINLPKGWSLQQPTRIDSIRSSYGTAKWEWETQDGIFYVNHEYRFYGQTISQESYLEYQDFLEYISKQDMVPAIFFKN